jgi:hypothetical protein
MELRFFGHSYRERVFSSISDRQHADRSKKVAFREQPNVRTHQTSYRHYLEMVPQLPTLRSTSFGRPHPICHGSYAFGWKHGVSVDGHCNRHQLGRRRLDRRRSCSCLGQGWHYCRQRSQQEGLTIPRCDTRPKDAVQRWSCMLRCCPTASSFRE